MAERSKFSALLTGVMSAVQKAATTAGQQNFYMLEHYFDRDQDGRLRPKVVRVAVSPGHTLEVPLISLVEPGGYKLDELEMELSLKLTLDQVKKATHETLDHQVKKGSYRVELCPRGSTHDHRKSDVVDVRIKFKGDDPSEGLMKIIDDLNNGITPRAEQPVDQASVTTETEIDDPIVIEEDDHDDD